MRRALSIATSVVTSGFAAVTLSACHVTPVYGDRVWHDLDADGVQDEGEPGVAGVTVSLFCERTSGRPGDLALCDVDQTDADGRYRLSATPGHRVEDTPDLQIEFERPEGFRFTVPNAGGAEQEATDSDADQLHGRTRRLTPSDGSEDWDAGLVSLAGAIGDRVWRDDDGDGVQDAGEPGVPDVEVQLLDAGGAEQESTTTGPDGGYLFDDLDPGSYRVRFSEEGTGLRFTPSDRGDDDLLDSDADPASGETAAVELAAEEDALGVDAGLTSRGAIGDRVWQDLDADGVQGPDEPGLTGVGVEVLGADGAVIAADESGPQGDYLFTGLPAGEYRIRFSLGEREDSAVFSRADRGGDDELDSDADPATGESHLIDLTMGEIDGSVDAGVVSFISAAQISGVVWHDDGDGIREAGEAEVEGVQVTLLDADGAVLATAQTNVFGRYAFRGLGAGDYRVRFAPPAGFGFTQPDAGEDELLDSDADPATGETPVVRLEAGDHDITVGAGLVALPSPGTAVIGDLVWRDDGNGIQDPGEPGVSNVTVTLLAQDGTELATTSTDGGVYSFTGLPAGTYRVRVQRPSGFSFTLPNAGTDDALDSDVSPATGETDGIALSDGETDEGVDAGLTIPS